MVEIGYRPTAPPTRAEKAKTVKQLLDFYSREHGKDWMVIVLCDYIIDRDLEKRREAKEKKVLP